MLLLWQLAVTALNIPEVILPAPDQIGGELWRICRCSSPCDADDPRYADGVRLATPLGVGLAIVLAYSPLLRDTLYPNLIVFQLVPKVALAPLFVVWLGIGSGSHVAFAAFVSFFPIVISTAVGFSSVDASALRLCRSLTASEWQCFLMVRFPFACRPSSAA